MELIPGLIDEMARECLIRIHPFSIFQSSLSSVSKSWSHEILHEFHRLRKSSNLTRPITVLSQAVITPPPSPPSSNPKSPVPLPTYWLTAFDPISSTFTRLPPSPSLPNGLPIFSSLVGCGSTLLILGGWDSISFQVSKSVHIFDFLTGYWRLGSDIPGCDRSLFGCTAASAGGIVVIAGGHDNEKHALRSVMAYEIQTDKWISLPDMERERDECTVVYQSGEFRVVSGYSTERQGCFERSAESFNLDKWRWSPVEEEFLAAGNGGVRCCVVGVDDGERVYTVQGGVVGVKTNHKWQELVEVESEVSAVQQVAVWRGKVMIIGGSSGGGGDGKMSAYVFESEIGKWCRVDVPEEFRGHVQSCCVMDL